MRFLQFRIGFSIAYMSWNDAVLQLLQREKVKKEVYFPLYTVASTAAGFLKGCGATQGFVVLKLERYVSKILSMFF
jgi:hypothetical protein